MMPPTPDNRVLRLDNSYRLSSFTNIALQILNVKKKSSNMLVTMLFSTQWDSLLYKRFTIKSTTHTGAVNVVVDACPALHVGGYALGMQKQLQ